MADSWASQTPTVLADNNSKDISEVAANLPIATDSKQTFDKNSVMVPPMTWEERQTQCPAF